MSQNVIIILGHDNMEESMVNANIKEGLKDQKNIVYKDLNALYPTGNIDVKKEQEDLENADKVVFQFPLYWYNSPAILKHWMDQVFEYGFVYDVDEKGDFRALALKDKKFQMIVSMGARKDAFEGEDRISVHECLNSFSYTAKMLGMQEQEPLFFYGAAYEKITPQKVASFIEVIKKRI